MPHLHSFWFSLHCFREISCKTKIVLYHFNAIITKQCKRYKEEKIWPTGSAEQAGLSNPKRGGTRARARRRLAAAKLQRRRRRRRRPDTVTLPTGHCAGWRRWQGAGPGGTPSPPAYGRPGGRRGCGRRLRGRWSRCGGGSALVLEGPTRPDSDLTLMSRHGGSGSSPAPDSDRIAVRRRRARTPPILRVGGTTGDQGPPRWAGLGSAPANRNININGNKCFVISLLPGPGQGCAAAVTLRRRRGL